MNEGTVALTSDNAIAAFHGAQKELREVYVRLKRFEREFVKYSKRQYSDAHVLAPAVEALLGRRPSSDTSTGDA